MSGPPSESDDAEVAALVTAAAEAASRAYCPYSQFPVGVALRTRDGRVFTGANVENAAYPAGMCAERVALYHAVTHGAAPGEFSHVVIHTRASRPTAPCGGCRQALSELAAGVTVIMVNADGAFSRTDIEALLPGAFGSDDLS